jgi:COP9 signalosome complex subunit 2
MDDAADEDYDFDYEEDEDEDVDADIENMYYNAKAKRSEDEDDAIADFEKVVEKEGSQKGDWGFKALKQMTKINFRRGQHTDALRSYTQLLGYTKSAVTRNYSEKSINGILDYVSAESANGSTSSSKRVADGRRGSQAATSNAIDLATMEKFYDVTKKALEEAKNERLSIKTDLKLARLWLARGEFGRLAKILKDLRTYCTAADGSDDQSKGTILLEIFALEIQMYGETANFKKLKETYDATLQVKSAIPHPRIMGIIRECGGKMHMSEKNWESAQIDFFQAFLNYDEAGSAQRIQVLKYLILAHMLMGSDINPFDSQETKPYKNDSQIVAMTDLVGAYQRREVHEAERILAENHSTIMDDPFIRTYIDDVLKGLRTQYLIDLIQPYTRIGLDFLSKQLNLSVSEVEDLVATLILDARIVGKIDQVEKRLELDRPRTRASIQSANGLPGSSLSQGTISEQRYAALNRWADEISRLGVLIEEKHANSTATALNASGSGTSGAGRFALNVQ